ncbi:MAG: hypothetical protein RR887_12525 [Niameybacter sp.]
MARCLECKAYEKKDGIDYCNYLNARCDITLDRSCAAYGLANIDVKAEMRKIRNGCKDCKREFSNDRNVLWGFCRNCTRWGKNPELEDYYERKVVSR